jgi:hypothetical protein
VVVTARLGASTLRCGESRTGVPGVGPVRMRIELVRRGGDVRIRAQHVVRTGQLGG